MIDINEMNGKKYKHKLNPDSITISLIGLAIAMSIWMWTIAPIHSFFHVAAAITFGLAYYFKHKR